MEFCSDEYVLQGSAPFIRDDRGIFEYSAKQWLLMNEMQILH